MQGNVRIFGQILEINYKYIGIKMGVTHGCLLRVKHWQIQRYSTINYENIHLNRD